VLAVDGLAVVFLNKAVMGALELPSFGEHIHLHHLGLLNRLLLGVVHRIHRQLVSRKQCIPWITAIHAGKEDDSKGRVANDTRFHTFRSKIQSWRRQIGVRPLTANFQEK